MAPWAALIPAAASLIGSLTSKKGGGQATGGQLPQLPTAPTTIQSMPSNFQPLSVEPDMQQLQPLNGQAMPQAPEAPNLADILGKAGGWMQQHPLLTAGMGAGAMGLATRGNPDAMLAGGALAGILARRKKRPTIGG